MQELEFITESTDHIDLIYYELKSDLVIQSIIQKDFKKNYLIPILKGISMKFNTGVYDRIIISNIMPYHIATLEEYNYTIFKEPHGLNLGASLGLTVKKATDEEINRLMGEPMFVPKSSTSNDTVIVRLNDEFDDLSVIDKSKYLYSQIEDIHLFEDKLSIMDEVEKNFIPKDIVEEDTVPTSKPVKDRNYISKLILPDKLELV